MGRAGQQTEGREQLDARRGEQRDDLGAGRVLTVQEEVGQEREGIGKAVRDGTALTQRLEIGQALEPVAGAELRFPVARVGEEPAASRELLRGAKAQRDQGARTENTEDTSPRARATAGISTMVVTLYVPSAASGGMLRRCSLAYVPDDTATSFSSRRRSWLP